MRKESSPLLISALGPLVKASDRISPLHRGGWTEGSAVGQSVNVI